MSDETILRELREFRERLGQAEERNRLLADAIEEIQIAEEELHLKNQELAQSHSAMEIERQRYFDLFENAPDAYIVTDAAGGKILEANKMAETLLCYARTALIGKPFSVFVPEEDRRIFRTKMGQLKRNEGITNWEIRLKPPTGDIRHVSISTAVMPSAERGGAGTWRWLIRDISERKRMERELRKQAMELASYAAKLEQVNGELQEFAFVASHDLQEPLRKIHSFGTRLANACEHSLGEQGSDYLARMLKAADRMSSLLSSLLSYSRVATQGKPPRTVDLTLVVQDAASNLEITIEETGATVEIGPLPTLAADEDQMRQLFQNLLANSLRYRLNGERPRIKIHGSDDGTMGRILVEDKGIGFDEKYLDRIFKPFQRLHGRNEYEGTGMGLAICRKIVERHNGSITAKSTPGEGATFIIDLPLRQ
ncbi:MAG: sensor histidine kinase [Acidobacteriota bacterium]